MIRAARVLLPLAILPLLLTACGTERVVVASREPLPPAPDRAELDARAQGMGIAPELVYITEAPGFGLAKQSVGVYGGDGFSAAYWSRKEGAELWLLVDRGTMTAANCPAQPIGQGTGGAAEVTCERDGAGWYRTSAGAHEYAVPEQGHVVRISADPALVGRDVLRAAARAVHRPNDSELAFLLPHRRPTYGRPIERGDLPPHGDGAPNNDVGASG